MRTLTDCWWIRWKLKRALRRPEIHRNSLRFNSWRAQSGVILINYQVVFISMRSFFCPSGRLYIHQVVFKSIRSSLYPSGRLYVHQVAFISNRFSFCPLRRLYVHQVILLSIMSSLIQSGRPNCRHHSFNLSPSEQILGRRYGAALNTMRQLPRFNQHLAKFVHSQCVTYI